MKSIVLGQERFKYLGGTTTLLVDLASALLRLGYTVYYWSTDTGSNSETELWFESHNIQKYGNQHVDMAITCQQTATMYFLNKCKVLQLLNSKFTPEEYPVPGCKAYVSVSNEIAKFVKDKFKLNTPVILNGIDLQRFKPNKIIGTTPSVLSICQGNDKLLEIACKELGYIFKSVPKDVGKRIWNIEDLIKDSDIVVGIGRSAYVGMSCGKCVISWDNRSLNPNTGCGYITEDNFFKCVDTNLTGRGFPTIDTVSKLKAELLKYNPTDGKQLRDIAEINLNADKNARIYIEMLEV